MHNFQSGLAQAGGITADIATSGDQYASGFTLAIRMIKVAVGVSLGLISGYYFSYLYDEDNQDISHFTF